MIVHQRFAAISVTLHAPAKYCLQLKLLHNTTTEIKVWSNVPGLQCKGCKRSGYPKTFGVDKVLYKTTPPVVEAGPKAESVVISVSDQTGFTMSVKMLNSVGFHFLMDAYATQAVRDRDICRFLFDGERLVEKETPKQVCLLNQTALQDFY